MFQKMIALMIIVFFSNYPVLAVKSFPPLVPDGEQLANSSELLHALFKNINRRSSFLSIAYSPDGKLMASGSSDNMVRLWEVATGKELQRHKGHNSNVNSVAYSPDGKLLASGSSDNTVRLWEVSTGKELQRLEGHNSDVNSVAYSPDGKHLASGSSDNTVRLWEMATGKELQRLEEHSQFVNSVAYSPDGRRLASGSSDNTVWLWEETTDNELKRFKRFKKLEEHKSLVSEERKSFVWSVAYSPNGKRLASGLSDNTVLLWDVDTGKKLNYHPQSGWLINVSPSKGLDQ